MKTCLYAPVAKFALIIGLLTWHNIAEGQNINSETGHFGRENNNPVLIGAQELVIRNLYTSRIESPNEIINGKEYEPYYLRSHSKPLLFPDRSRTGIVLTKTRRYHSPNIEYDTYLDEVIITDVSRTINFRFPKIALNKDVVEGFEICFDNDTLEFRYIREPLLSGASLQAGFYEIAYEGKSSLWIKHRSKFYVREGIEEYKYSPEYYISAGDGFLRVKNTKSILSITGPESGIMKKYLHSNRIRVSRADKQQLISILKYYDTVSAAGEK